jgi:serine/threonine protein kinase
MDRESVPAAEDDRRPPASSAGALPRQFGKYTLLRRLAAGGMAELFLALHRSVAGFEKLMVIKRILPSVNEDKAFIDMLLHEARIAATLSHPNIVHIFDVGHIDGTYFIAMEHIHGEDIGAILRAMKKKGQREFPLEYALSIVLGATAGLAYAHDKRDLDGAPLHIVHRDISPRNIVVSFTGDVKIVDFGIAKSTSEPVDDTQGGQIKGKASYMSPEQASGQPVDWRSDIFAAGVMLFELTTGRRLFRGASEFETLKLICDKEYPRPTEIKPDYPKALEQIVMRALAKKRDERYQSARELQADLEDFVREERIAVSPVSLARWMQLLFQDQLVEQKEALQDVKQLADVIAAQHSTRISMHSIYDGTGPGTLSSAGAASLQPPPAPKRRPIGLPLAALGAGVFFAAGFFYTEMRAPRPSTPPTPSAPPAPSAHAEHDPPEALSPPDPEPRSALEIESQPEGCSIWLNGDLRPELTPARIERLPLGQELSVKLTKDGFDAYREAVTLTVAQPSQKLSLVMKRSDTATVLLKIRPPVAVWVDGTLWTGDWRRVDISAGEKHKIVVAAQGFLPKTYPVLARPGETKTIFDQLVKAEGNSPE